MGMFKSMLAMDHVTSNNNGKIWLIWTTEVSCKVLEADEQQITCEINHVEVPGTYIKTFVSSKCKDYLKRPLWERMLHYADTRNDILGVGPLAQFIEDNNKFNNDIVLEFIEEGGWNINKIIQLAPPTQVHNILATSFSFNKVFQTSQCGTSTVMVCSPVLLPGTP
ncbi:hypothetical protein H5410_061108 [Solanum commersonii]|uniref:Uncharacterized protein n=1 Tax=Solanum commersonii TaxID=4109 RepID=A0A9J5W8M1_SOLCO|nr:hypothetical protein H5410_061108 [Solanum commersonii]